jgi:hypothetical protein
MGETNERSTWRGPIAIGGLVGAIIDPVTRRRGFATADLIAAWPEVVGARYADCTRPEKIVWPRGENAGPAQLVMRVDGPRAVLVQHEAGQILERVNAFLGYGAIGRLKIIQAPVERPQTPETAAARPLSAAEETRLGAAVAKVGEEPLRAALERLGRGVLAAGRDRE